jgi:hypothetical protein
MMMVVGDRSKLTLFAGPGYLEVDKLDEIVERLFGSLDSACGETRVWRVITGRDKRNVEEYRGRIYAPLNLSI